MCLDRKCGVSQGRARTVSASATIRVPASEHLVQNAPKFLYCTNSSQSTLRHTVLAWNEAHMIFQCCFPYFLLRRVTCFWISAWFFFKLRYFFEYWVTQDQSDIAPHWGWEACLKFSGERRWDQPMRLQAEESTGLLACTKCQHRPLRLALFLFRLHSKQARLII